MSKNKVAVPEAQAALDAIRAEKEAMKASEE